MEVPDSMHTLRDGNFVAMVCEEGSDLPLAIGAARPETIGAEDTNKPVSVDGDRVKDTFVQLRLVYDQLLCILIK